MDVSKYKLSEIQLTGSYSYNHTYYMKDYTVVGEDDLSITLKYNKTGSITKINKRYILYYKYDCRDNN